MTHSLPPAAAATDTGLPAAAPCGKTTPSSERAPRAEEGPAEDDRGRILTQSETAARPLMRNRHRKAFSQRVASPMTTTVQAKRPGVSSRSFDW